jgi:FkbH-like protein
MLNKEHSIWLPPGFGAWIETALKPSQEMVAFDPEAIFLLLDSSHATFDADSALRAKSSLETAFPNATIIVPELEDLADEVGAFFDERMWKIGSMPWSMKGLRAIKDEINRLIRAMKGERKKVLALDFDNTLWSGVIGEDGVNGIKPYTEFQRGIKALKERGVVLVGLTKNNLADVEPVWTDERMVLKLNDFALLKIDWSDKASNLASAAKELNLGIDSFVFVDDNPAEREQMKAMLPEVVVPEVPQDEAMLTKFLRRIARLYFPELRLTDEDRRKTAQYIEESARREFAATLSVDDYLRGLKMWADVHQIADAEIPRVAQLSQKTNQFNVLTNRYTIDEVNGFAHDGGRVLLTVHSGDRFGDQGLVAFVQAVVAGDKATIVDWVMSCRTMNRRLEFAVEERLELELSRRGISHVLASWRRTLKNAPVENLFDAFGFDLVEVSADERKYELKLPRKEALKHYVDFK